MATTMVAPQQVVQMQCPAGAGPGYQLEAVVGDQKITVTVPPGVCSGQMFQVQVPTAQPQQQPMAQAVAMPAPGQAFAQQMQPLLNPMGSMPMIGGGGNILDMCPGIMIKQVVNVVELLTGCEMRNKYTGHIWDPNNPTAEGQQILYFEEQEGGGCQRICCKQNRDLQLNMYEGHNSSGNVLMQFYKSFGFAELCCYRPEVLIFDGAGTKIGHIDDPFKCCVMDQRVYDPNGTQIYGVAGSVCQIGICCPCMGDVHFDITDAGGQPVQGAKISKVFAGCAELMAKVNNFTITFPAGATTSQKLALIGTTMLIDFEYFEKKD